MHPVALALQVQILVWVVCSLHSKMRSLQGDFSDDGSMPAHLLTACAGQLRLILHILLVCTSLCIVPLYYAFLLLEYLLTFVVIIIIFMIGHLAQPWLWT